MNDDPIVIEGELTIFQADYVLKESGATELHKVIAFERDGHTYEIRMRRATAREVSAALATS